MTDDFPDWPDARAARRFFNRAARTADVTDVLGREVERRMFDRLQYVRLAPERIADLGCGTGHGVQLMREKFPRSHVIGIDAAEAMLTVATRRRTVAARWLDRLASRGPSWMCGDFGSLPLAVGSIDLAWSNLAVAWAADPPQLFGEVRRILKPGGLLMFSTYGPDTLRELRAAYAAADSLPHTHRFVDMHDLGDMLVESGFATPVMDMETITLTYDGFDALASDLRGSGQLNAARGRRRGLTGAASHHRAQRAYDRVRIDGRLPATFEIVYGHAWRGEPRMPRGEPAVIHFEVKQKRGA